MHRPRHSSRPLPPYAFVPGFSPHPASDPRGHMYGHRPATPAPLAPETWRRSEDFLYGVDLFNHGFYWEAHEAWEGLWLAAGRVGPTALWLKALIKLAAAAVKLREGNVTGATRHATRARTLLQEFQIARASHSDSAASSLGMQPPVFSRYCGIDLENFEHAAATILDAASTPALAPDANRLLECWLQLESPGQSR